MQYNREFYNFVIDYIMTQSLKNMYPHMDSNPPIFWPAGSGLETDEEKKKSWEWLEFCKKHPDYSQEEMDTWFEEYRKSQVATKSKE